MTEIKLKKIFGIVVFLLLSPGCRTPSESGVLGSLDENPQLEVQLQRKVPLQEISAMCQRPSIANTEIEIIIAGDSEFKLVIASKDDQSAWHFTEKSIAGIPGIKNGKLESQWEGAACDSTGILALLDESPGAVYILDKELTKILSRINLKFNSHTPAGWQDEPNSRGEGLAFLKNGHILILKEKKEPMLIEYGPENDNAEGVSQDLLVLRSDKFPIPNKDVIDFFPLKIWKFHDETLSLIKDFSEIAITDHGQIYILSQKSKMIGRIEGKLGVDETYVNFRKLYNIPKGIKSAEAMIILRDGRPIIGQDIKDKGFNFFELDPLK